MELDIGWIAELVSRHCPVFYLHHDDQYLPCSAEFFMQHSALKARRPDGSIAVLAPQGSLCGAVLCQFQSDNSDGHHLWMELDPGARCGQPLEQLNDVPVYAHIKAILSTENTDNSTNKVEALEITYITLFAYNGHYEVIPYLIKTGAHDGDIEHITARVHPTTGNLIAMWYNSHRSRDGKWVAASDVPRNSEGRVLAYIALHGHGNYPSSGRVLRHFFLGNDTCSDQGPIWKPKNVVLLHAVEDNDSTEQQEQQQQEMQGEPRRKLQCTPSRGCSHSSEATESAIEVKAVTAEGTPNDSTKESTGINRTPHVITDDPCDWVFFRGQWGQTDAPITQSWYHQAETPVSRTSMQRLFFHLWPETDKI